jgi:hypothetical protein
MERGHTFPMVLTSSHFSSEFVVRDSIRPGKPPTVSPVVREGQGQEGMRLNQLDQQGLQQYGHRQYSHTTLQHVERSNQDSYRRSETMKLRISFLNKHDPEMV